MASGEGGIVAGELMASEIAEQPAIVAGLLRAERDHVQEIAAALRARWEEIAFVSIAARGTSDNAARYAQYLFGALTGRAVALATPALFTLYETPPDLRRALTIGISQSGASPDIVAVLTEARRQGAPTLAITNDPDSPLAGAAEFVLPIHAGIERSVAATKTYMAQLLALAMLATALSAGDPARRWEELAAIAPTIAATTRLDAAIARGAERYRDIGQLVTGGRGYCYGTAFEAALKLKETCYLLAEPYSPPDFIHGPVAIIEPGYRDLARARRGPADRQRPRRDPGAGRHAAAPPRRDPGMAQPPPGDRAGAAARPLPGASARLRPRPTARAEQGDADAVTRARSMKAPRHRRSDTPATRFCYPEHARI